MNGLHTTPGYHGNPQDYQYVSDFLFMWGFLERKLTKRYEQHGKSLSIRFFNSVVDNDIEENSNDKIEKAFEFYKERYGKDNAEALRIRLRFRETGSEKDAPQLCINSFENKSPSPSEKFHCVAFIATRIRNNLFHGTKELQEINEIQDLLEMTTSGLQGIAIACDLASDPPV